jgi:hypothetical protein
VGLDGMGWGGGFNRGLVERLQYGKWRGARGGVEVKAERKPSEERSSNFGPGAYYCSRGESSGGKYNMWRKCERASEMQSFGGANLSMRIVIMPDADNVMRAPVAASRAPPGPSCTCALSSFISSLLC